MLSRSILASVKYVDCQLEGFAFLFLHFQQKVMHLTSLSFTASRIGFQANFFNKKINPTNINTCQRTNQTQTDVLTYPYISKYF
jgi:hypothetical protein